MIRNLSFNLSINGRNISYDTPKPGINSNVGAFSSPNNLKFIPVSNNFYMNPAMTRQKSSKKNHLSPVFVHFNKPQFVQSVLCVSAEMAPRAMNTSIPATISAIFVAGSFNLKCAATLEG